MPGGPSADHDRRPPAALADESSTRALRAEARDETGEARIPDSCPEPADARIRLISAPPGTREALQSSAEAAPRPRRLAWSELLQPVFAIDVLECPRCGGRMRLLAAIQPPDVTQSILECLDLPTRAPPLAAALPDPDDAQGWPGDLDATV